MADNSNETLRQRLDRLCAEAEAMSAVGHVGRIDAFQAHVERLRDRALADGQIVARIPQSDTTGTAFAGGRYVDTNDLAEVKLFVLWYGDVHVEHHFGKYHGVFLTKQGAMAACPGEGRLWEPSAQFPFDAWILFGTMWYVRRYNPGFVA